MRCRAHPVPSRPQVRKYWLLARMCNDVIVHVSSIGFFLYLSPECKQSLGYPPHGLSESQLLRCVHPEDLEAMKQMCDEPGEKERKPAYHQSTKSALKAGRRRGDGGDSGTGGDGSFKSSSGSMLESTTSDSECERDGIVRAQLRLQNSAGSYMLYTLYMHPIKPVKPDQTEGTAVRSMVGAIPRHRIAYTVPNGLVSSMPSSQQSSGESSFEGTPLAGRTSGQLTKMLAEAFSSISMSPELSMRPPELAGAACRPSPALIPSSSMKAGTDASLTGGLLGDADVEVPTQLFPSAKRWAGGRALGRSGLAGRGSVGREESLGGRGERVVAAGWAMRHQSDEHGEGSIEDSSVFAVPVAEPSTAHAEGPPPKVASGRPSSNDPPPVTRGVVPLVRKARASWEGKSSCSATQREESLAVGGVEPPACIAPDQSPVDSEHHGGDEQGESSLEDSPIHSSEHGLERIQGAVSWDAASRACPRSMRRPKAPSGGSHAGHGASGAERGTRGSIAADPAVSQSHDAPSAPQHHDLQELVRTMALESERALASKRQEAQCAEAQCAEAQSSGREAVAGAVDDRELLQMLREEHHPWIIESAHHEGAVAGGGKWVSVPCGHQKSNQRRPVLERSAAETSAFGGSRYGALDRRGSRLEGSRRGAKSDDSNDDTEAEDEGLAGVGVGGEALQKRGRPHGRTDGEQAARRVGFDMATANHRRLRESASASQATSDEGVQASAAAKTLEKGRQCAHAQQELARQTLHGFFPDGPEISVAPPLPHSTSRSGVTPADANEAAQQHTDARARPQEHASEIGAMEEGQPPPPAEMAGSGEAAEAAEECDAQGLLQLKLLRNYFVPRDPTTYSPLAAVVLAPTPPSHELLEQLLASPGTDVNAGGSCGWQPLSLALLGGDARVDIVRTLLRQRADLEATPTGRPQQTALLLAASARQTKCVQALVAAGACVNARDRDGQTALLHCTTWLPDERALRACELLMEKSADFTIRSPNGQLAALACALEAGNGKTAAMLQARMEEARELAEQQLTAAEDGTYQRGSSAPGAKKTRQSGGNKSAAGGKNKPGRAH